MVEMIHARSAEALIEKAKESYVLGLIDRHRLGFVVEQALTRHGYDAILDLPLHHELQMARDLAEREAKRARRGVSKRG